MKKTIKLLSLLLAMLMLASTVPVAFASGECTHDSMYKVEICPDGNSNGKLFMTKPNINMIINFEYSGAGVGVYTDEFYYCPTCNSLRQLILRDGIFFADYGWEKVSDIEEHSSIELVYGIYRPGSCIHKNRIDLPIEPTCKSYYLDRTKCNDELKGTKTPEKYEEWLNEYGVLLDIIGDPNGSKISLCFSYCPDCKQMYYNLSEFNGDGSVKKAEYGTLEPTFKDGSDAIRAAVSPALAHSFVDGKCENCGQADPSVPDPTEPTQDEPTQDEPTQDEPTQEEPEKKSFFDKVVDFFNKIIDWFKNLFSFLK